MEALKIVIEPDTSKHPGTRDFRAAQLKRIESLAEDLADVASSLAVYARAFDLDDPDGSVREKAQAAVVAAKKLIFELETNGAP